MDVTQSSEESDEHVTTSAFNREFFKAQLKAKKLTSPSAAADAFGMYRNDFWRLMQGQIPRLHRGLKIARILGVDPLAIWPEGCEADE